MQLRSVGYLRAVVSVAALRALFLADVHTRSQGSQEQREPLRVRRPGEARHQIAIPNGPVRRRLDILATRKTHLRCTSRIARYPPTAEHIGSRQDLDRMADGRNRLVLGPKRSKHHNCARVQPAVFSRASTRE